MVPAIATQILAHPQVLQNIDLSSLTSVYVGASAISVPQKQALLKLLASRGARRGDSDESTMPNGYGMSEVSIHLFYYHYLQGYHNSDQVNHWIEIRLQLALLHGPCKVCLLTKQYTEPVLMMLMVSFFPAHVGYPCGPARPGTIGVLLPGLEARIISEESDSASGIDVPLNTAGELWLRGPMVMKGYLNNEIETKNALTEDGWFKTGDKVG